MLDLLRSHNSEFITFVMELQRTVHMKCEENLLKNEMSVIKKIELDKSEIGVRKKYLESGESGSEGVSRIFSPTLNFEEMQKICASVTDFDSKKFANVLFSLCLEYNTSLVELAYFAVEEWFLGKKEKTYRFFGCDKGAYDIYSAILEKFFEICTADFVADLMNAFKKADLNTTSEYDAWKAVLDKLFDTFEIPQCCMFVLRHVSRLMQKDGLLHNYEFSGFVGLFFGSFLSNIFFLSKKPVVDQKIAQKLKSVAIGFSLEICKKKSMEVVVGQGGISTLLHAENRRNTLNNINTNLKKGFAELSVAAKKSADKLDSISRNSADKFFLGRRKDRPRAGTSPASLDSKTNEEYSAARMNELLHFLTLIHESEHYADLCSCGITFEKLKEASNYELYGMMADKMPIGLSKRIEDGLVRYVPDSMVSKIAHLALFEDIDYTRMEELPVLPYFQNSLLLPENKVGYKNYMRLKFEHQQRAAVKARVNTEKNGEKDTEKNGEKDVEKDAEKDAKVEAANHRASLRYAAAPEEEDLFATFDEKRRSEMFEIEAEVMNRVLEEYESKAKFKNLGM